MFAAGIRYNSQNARKHTAFSIMIDLSHLTIIMVPTPLYLIQSIKKLALAHIYTHKDKGRNDTPRDLKFWIWSKHKEGKEKF